MPSSGLRRRYYFIGALALIIVLYLLFANTLIKTVAEAKMGEAYGAEVNIGSVSHSLYPTTVTLKQIELTNPTKPTHNQVLIGTASADVALMPLLSNRVVVNQLSVLEVQFDQPRTSPGEVYRVPERSLTFDEMKQKVQEDIPSVDELLARNPLKTSAAVEQAQDTYAQYEASLKESYQTLPDKARLDYYKSQIEGLKETKYSDPQALLQAKNALSELKEQMKADREKISTFSEQAKTARSDLKATIAALKDAPKQDYALLQGLIAGDQAALSQVTQFVFGDKAAEYTQYLTSALQVVLPLINGQETTSDSSAEVPSVLVKQADVSVLWQNETITSNWQNITNTHALIGSPTTFTIKGLGEKLKSFQSSGQFWIDDDGVDASQQWDISDINLANIPLSSNEKLNAMLTSALLKSAGSLTVENNQLSGQGEVDLLSLAMQATGENKVSTAIASALESLTSLSMSMLFNGSIDNPGFSVKSDLDNKLAKAALSQLTDSQKGKLDELNQKLNDMVSNQLSATNEQLVSVNGLLEAAQGNSDMLSGLMDTQLSGLVDEQKNKLLDKLKGKFGQG
ncbi:TIGR03545 family protein [Alteromonas sp. CYL-A6]|uniref:TIGR03545 family protein n=1 Tax=Alteromonas nitratireducens TaxID=3390813 RepID=UPI0034AD9DEF